MGAWTRYEISFGRPDGSAPAITMREHVALVGRSAGGWLMESESRMGSVPGAPRLIMQLDLARGDTSGNSRQLLVQVEDGQPLDASNQKARPDMPAPNFLESSTGRKSRDGGAIRFQGTSLATRTWQARASDGLEWQIWCSDRVQPLGVVRLQVRGKRNGQPIVYDMKAIETGKSATRRVVRKPVPYSDQAMFAQLNRATMQALPARPGGEPASSPGH